MGEQRRRWIQGSGFLTAGMLVMAAMLPMAHAEVRLLPGAAADLDQATTSSVLKTFQQAEEALRARSVDGVMALYAEHYDYHGLHKQDMRKVWVDLLDQFQDLADVANVAVVVQYMATCMAILVLRRKAPAGADTFVIPLGPLVPIAALAGCCAFLRFVKAEELKLAAIMIGIGLVIGAIWRQGIARQRT